MIDALGLLRRFRSNERGNIALLFGLTLVPVVSAAGVAVDYSTASNMRTAIQSEADAAALDAAKAAVDIHTDPAHSSKTPAQRQALVDAKIPQVMAARKTMVDARNSTGGNVTFTGSWDDTLKTQYKVVASINAPKRFRLLSSDATTPVAATAVAVMKYNALLKPGKPEMIRPGFNAGDYNRLFAYCYNKNEADPAKRRTQMTAVTSNGSSGSKMEVEDAEIFKNVTMPECDYDKGETVSWRLLNIRDSRTHKPNWPIDIKGTQIATYYVNGAVTWSVTYVDGVTTTMTTGGTATGAVRETKTTEVWRSDLPTGLNNSSTNPQTRQVYNHYSDTIVNADTGLESFQFTGDQMGYYAPLNMMETVVCSTKDLCNPDKPGSIVPKGSNRTPTPATTKCEPGKFLYIGFEDRPYVPGRPSSDYSTWGSGYWTDRDYEDITFVISCPSLEITDYTRSVRLMK
jgi:Flp pilus assembly protein TadG